MYSIPESVPIVLLSCFSAKEREDDSTFAKDVYNALEHKRSVTGFRGAAILDASSEIMRIVSIVEDKEDYISEQQDLLELKHNPQGEIDAYAVDKKKDKNFYTSLVESKGLAGFFSDFLKVVNGAIDQSGCITYTSY